MQNYNILQNNGRLAHQEVDHVHFHIIPKTTEHGLGIHWKANGQTQDELKVIHEDLMSKIANL